MRRLLAIVTCRELMYPTNDCSHAKGVNKRVEAVLDTWYRLWRHKYSDKVDLQFFVGRGVAEPNLPHYVALGAPDDYYGLPHKIKAVMKYAHDAGYNFIHKLDDDVALFLPRLLHELPANDYTGYAIRSADLTYASGTHYCLSRRAMKFVVDAAIPEGEWREDHFVGSVLARNNISLVHEERFLCCHCDNCLQTHDKDALISVHTSKPEQLYTLMER